MCSVKFSCVDSNARLVRLCFSFCRAGRCYVARGWDLQDARGVEVATYADLYGKLQMCKPSQFAKLNIDANWISIAGISDSLATLAVEPVRIIHDEKRYFNGF